MLTGEALFLAIKINTFANTGRRKQKALVILYLSYISCSVG